MTKFQYMLAPLEDFTDNAFRTLGYRHGADLTFTELLRIEALANNIETTWSRIEKKDNTPTIIQLLGSSEKYLEKFLERFKPFEGFRGFNLNLGCPDPQTVSLGQGCAMVKKVALVKNLVNMIKGKGYSCSIKMRLGKNIYDKQKKVYLNLIKEVDADFFIVHARHGKEGYDKKPDYSIFKECCDTGKIIIANGDIDSKEKVEILKSFGVGGVMIGRSAINNPQIFNFLKGNKLVSSEEIKKEYAELAEKYDAPFRYRKNIIKRLFK
ncbi:MAG: tRNA-dihydrouridine synthase family protein [archaeon]|nr:tRNA-dihydrouridine synthase family protein [archaeon]